MCVCAWHTNVHLELFSEYGYNLPNIVVKPLNFIRTLNDATKFGFSIIHIFFRSAIIQLQFITLIIIASATAVGVFVVAFENET